MTDFGINRFVQGNKKKKSTEEPYNPVKGAGLADAMKKEQEEAAKKFEAASRLREKEMEQAEIARRAKIEKEILDELKKSELLRAEQEREIQALRQQAGGRKKIDDEEEEEDSDDDVSSGRRSKSGQSSAGSLLVTLQLGSGAKTAVDMAEKISGVWSKLNSQEIRLLYKSYKKFPCDPTKTMQVVDENVSKAKASILTVRKAANWGDVPAQNKKAVEDYRENALACIPIFVKMVRVQPKLSWDHIGIMMAPDAKEVWTANQTFEPTVPIALYSKAYAVGSDFEEIASECWMRTSIGAKALVLGSALLNLKLPLSRDSIKTAAKKVVAPTVVDSSAPLTGMKRVLDMIEQAKSDLDVDILLKGGYIMDIKVAWQTADFKQAKKGSKVMIFCQQQTVEYVFFVIGLSDSLFGTANLAKVTKERDFDSKSTLGEEYYKALRGLRELLRDIKIKIYGGRAGDPRANAEHMDFSDIPDIDYTKLGRDVIAKLFN